MMSRTNIGKVEFLQNVTINMNLVIKIFMKITQISNIYIWKYYVIHKFVFDTGLSYISEILVNCFFATGNDFL